MDTNVQAREDFFRWRATGFPRRVGVGRLARTTLAFALGMFLVAATTLAQAAPYTFKKIADLYNAASYPMIDGAGRVYFVQGTPDRGTGLMVGDETSVWWAVEPPVSSPALRSVAANGMLLYSDGTCWPGNSTWLLDPATGSRVLAQGYVANDWLWVGGTGCANGDWMVEGSSGGDANANGEAVLHVWSNEHCAGREALVTTYGLPFSSCPGLPTPLIHCCYEVVATLSFMGGNYYTFAAPRINDAADVVFVGREPSSGGGIGPWTVFKVTGGTTTAVYTATCTPGHGGGFGSPSLNNIGKVAFKEYGACGSRIVFVDESGPSLLDTKPDYTASGSLTLNDLDQVAYLGTESLPSGVGSYAAITGPGLSWRRIVSAGDTVDGHQVLGVYLNDHAFNNRGQLAICLHLSDGATRWYGIYRADPAQDLTVATVGDGWGFVESDPPGIECGETCSETFDFDTVVTLTAFGSGNSVFAGWSGEGCSGSGTCQVTMDQARNVTATFTLALPPTVEIAGPTEVCVGQSLTLDAGPNFASYLWSPGGETTQLITVSPTTPTTYTVTVSNASGNSTTSAPHTVTVESVPSALISAPILLSPNAASNVASVPDAGPGASYSWSITGGIIESGEASSRVVFSTSSTTPVNLRVTVENTAGCSSVASRDISIRQCTGPLLTPQATYLTGHGNSHIAVGDFNLDGNADLAIGNIVRHSISVTFGDGQGNFGANIEFATVYSPHFVVAADVNEDGNLDLVAADNNFIAGHGTIGVHIGDGRGAFASLVAVSCPTNAFALALGDFNEDGHLDLALVTTWSDVTVMVGDGTGAFGSPMSYTVGSSTFAIAAADLNGDGHLDLAVADRNAGQAPVLLGHGDGTFSVAAPVALGNGTISVAMADLNGDGVLDLVLGHEFDRGLSVVLGDGGGSFQSAVHFAFGEPQKITIDDFDGDGHPDIAAAEYRHNALKVLLGDGTGDFPATVSLPAGFLPTAAAEGDFNGDGRPDLAVSNYGDYRDTTTPSLSVYLNARLSGLRPRVSGPPQVCAGHSVTLEAGLGFGSYLWSPGGETTGAITVSPTTTTSYSVTVTNAFGCSIASDPRVVTVSECPRWALSVDKTGTGTGLVVSTPAGVDCGESCSALFDDTVLVTLIAAPNAGSKFVGWSGEGCSGTGTCTVMMDADRSVAATFEPAPIATERQALLDLYNATNGLGWANNANWGGPPGTECTWYGVTCDPAQTTVVGLWLANNNLVGTLPASLGTLTNLRVLSLNQNRLSGALPTELGSLSQLVMLDAWGNQFTGQIPNLAQLTKLMDLYLGNNSFDPGPFAAWLVSLTQLRHVWVGNCNLSGPIPASIGSLTNLETLGLGGNHLTGQIPDLSALTALTSLSLDLNPFDPGPIPSWVSTLTHLQELWLVGTNRTGPIPDLGALTNLTALHLGANSFDPGPFPTWVTNLAQLRSLGLWSCNLTGPIPSGIGTLTNLEDLSLSQNQLSGPIPPELGTLTHLKWLNLWGNPFTGPIPDLHALVDLVDLWFGGSQFEPGPIPAWLTSLPHLRGVSFWSCNLTGPIPSSLGSIKTLEILGLDGNQLTGPIPDLSPLAHLTELSLGGNPFDPGPIPPWLAALTQLRSLRLWSCGLTGPIPNSLASLTSLETLDLSSNHLTGPIPAAVGALVTLVSLNLSGNQIAGAIPSEIGTLGSLRYLSLSQNQLSGSVPPELGNLTQLGTLDLWGNQFTGSFPDFHALINLTSLTLSSPFDSGPMPAWLGDLTRLRGLGLWGCNFTGPIPSALGSLTSMEWLNLSWNQLTGTIPDLSGLTNLTYLALSGNQFDPAPIPSWLPALTHLQQLELWWTNRTGSIPAELGTLANLRYLVLDQNHLSGSIPPELGGLTQAEVLGLSGNQLAGAIPGSLVALTNLQAGQLDLRWNALDSLDVGLTSFLNTKQAGGDWQGTQTVAPMGLTAGNATATSVVLSWTPIAYTADSGGYRAFVATAPGGPFTESDITADKNASSLIVSGLTPNTPFYFLLRTVTNPHGNNPNTVFSEPSDTVAAVTPPICQPSLSVTFPPSGDPLSFINGYRVQINGSAAVSMGCPEISKIEWDWGDGTIGAQAFPATHHYQTHGTFSVVVTAFDAGVPSHSTSVAGTVFIQETQGSTEPGSDVTVNPVDPVTGTSPATITFGEVTSSGVTTVSTSSGGRPPEAGFRLAGNTYLEIATDATYTPPVRVCVHYGSFGINDKAARLHHLVAQGATMHDGSTCSKPNGCWEDITDPSNPPTQPNPDTVNKIICGTANSLSPFAVVETIEIVAPVDPKPVNTTIEASLLLTDPSTVDVAEWTWGDGSMTSGSIMANQVTGSHSYSTPGTYTVGLRLLSQGLEVGSAAFRYIVIYDPNAGFVTGGGWITSPPGAYVPDPALTGQANFGFVSAYKKGQSTPTGTTEFQFQVANLNFHSSTYEWLVVAGARAQFKGAGTINGQANFGFMLTAIDGALSGGGGADKFRIKIWDRASGAIVYDNQLGAADDGDPTTVIGGGSIVIHKTK